MIVKLFEVRDKATFIPVIAIKLGSRSEAERYLLARAGYGRTLDNRNMYRYILLCRATGKSEINYDPYDWPNRTMLNAHLFIRDSFDDLESGAVIDVQFILGETTNPKKSEAENQLL